MKKLLIFAIFVLIFLLFKIPASAVDCEGTPPSGSGNENQIREYIEKCQAKITSLQSEQKTLKSTILVINSKINLTQGQINQTTAQIEALEKDIGILSEVVGTLSTSQNEMETVYRAKVREFYKNRTPSPLILFLSSDSLSSFLTRLKYLDTARTRDRIMLVEIEKAKNSYDQQKNLKINKQNEVEKLKKQMLSQKADLDSARKQKNLLLTQTQNDEKLFQQLLSKAKAELDAIEAVIAGKGTETEVGGVSVGDRIATIIAGSSACSTGGHLHFEVAKDKVNHNPAGYLKDKTVIWNNSPDSSFSFTGAWDWPLNDPIRITQGFGQTSYSSRYSGNLHSGIDMVSEDSSVKAVRAGTLFRGSIACGGGTLKYVHVKNKDDNNDVYYLHVNYF